MTGRLSVIGRIAVRSGRRPSRTSTAGRTLGPICASTIGRAVLVVVGLGRQSSRFGTGIACSAPIIRTATAPSQEQGGHRCTHQRCRSRGFDQHVLYFLLFAK